MFPLLILGAVLVFLTLSASVADSAAESNNSWIYILVYSVRVDNTSTLTACVIPEQLATGLSSLPSEGVVGVRLGSASINATLIAEGPEALKHAKELSLKGLCQLPENVVNAYIFKVKGGASLPSWVTAKSYVTAYGEGVRQTLTPKPTLSKATKPLPAATEASLTLQTQSTLQSAASTTQSMQLHAPGGVNEASRLTSLIISLLAAAGVMYLASLLIKKF